MNEAMKRRMFVSTATWTEIRNRANLLRAKGGTKALEEAAHLVAEAEFCGKIPPADALPQDIRASFAYAGHPLGWLCLRRLSIEHDVCRWETWSDGTAGPLGFSFDALAPPPPLAYGPPAAFGRVIKDAPQSLAAFGPALEAWGGIASSISVELINRARATRGLAESLEEVFEPLKRGAYGYLVSCREPAANLLEVAISGGGDDRAPGVATARLNAWHALRWLVTTDEQMTMESVAARIEECSWIRFETRRPWFDGNWLDGCYGCLDPDGQRLAVVAWTAS